MTDPASSMLVHASCAAFGPAGVLITGGSGSGKSSLLLRLIDAEGFGLGTKALRAKLVADDQVLIVKTGKTLSASAPATISGLIELRGLGILKVPFKSKVRLALVIALTPQAEIERMPEERTLKTTLLGVEIPRIKVDPTLAAAPAQIRTVLSKILFTGGQKALDRALIKFPGRN